MPDKCYVCGGRGWLPQLNQEGVVVVKACTRCKTFTGLTDRIAAGKFFQWFRSVNDPNNS